jgi:hypothetical protein
VAHNEHQSDELTLICREQRMSGCELLPEERDRVTALMKHGAHADTGGITLHDEGLVKI